MALGAPSTLSAQAPALRLVRVHEINEEEHHNLRQELANVYASLNPDERVRFVYLLDGRCDGVDLYFGLAADSEFEHGGPDLYEYMKTLRGALQGQLPGVNFSDAHIKTAAQRQALLERIAAQPHRGFLVGVPTAQETQVAQQDVPNFQDLNRLVSSLQDPEHSSKTWQITIISQPLRRQEIQSQLNAAYVLATELANDSKTNVQLGSNTSDTTGSNWGESSSRSEGTNTSRTIGSNTSRTSGTNTSRTDGRNSSHTSGQNSSQTRGKNESDTFGRNSSRTDGENSSTTDGTNTNHTAGTNKGGSRSTNTGTNWSTSTGGGKTYRDGESKNNSRVDGRSQGSADSTSWGESTSTSTGSSRSQTSGTSRSQTQGESSSKTQGSSSSDTHGTSTSDTHGTSSSDTRGTSNSDTHGQSESDTSGTSLSTTLGSNRGGSDSRSSGHNFNLSQEFNNKEAQHRGKYVEEQLIARLQKGLAKGLFHTAIYLSASDGSLYTRLKNAARATFQGSQSTRTPLNTVDLPALNSEGVLAHAALLSLPKSNASMDGKYLLELSALLDADARFGSLLTGDELSIVASLPEHEMPGIRRRRVVGFAVALPEVPADKHALSLGKLINHGRTMVHNKMQIVGEDLNKHTFITGVTGAGKTTTCMTLLLGSGLPFLVIEPAKTEYRELQQYSDKLPTGDLHYYRPNGDQYQSLRINPFALVRKNQRIKGQAGFLKNIIASTFELEAAMPSIIEDAILKSYEDCGWDIHDNQFLGEGDPFDPLVQAWPTWTQMVAKLDALIPHYGLGKELEEKYRGSLVARLRNLTDGTLGQIIDVPQSMDFGALLERCAVIELEELQSGEEKALLMAIILGNLNEAVREKHAHNKHFRHLTLIEEAHRLLAKPEPGNASAVLAVQAFADMLAEVRKFGEGLIIADQIPAKLIPDVIKNTHTKIVHRLFAEDDRRAMGEAMMMDDKQRAFLPNLGVGEAVVFCGGWHGAAHGLVDRLVSTTGLHASFDPFTPEVCAARLWLQRLQYYPQLCLVQGFAALQSSESFARFVSETSSAQRQLLRVCAWLHNETHRPADKLVAGAWAQLRRWHASWSSQAQPAELAQAWGALMHDSVLRPYTDSKGVRAPSLARLHATSAELLDLFHSSATFEEFKAQTLAVAEENPDLDQVLITLANFKSL